MATLIAGHLRGAQIEPNTVTARCEGCVYEIPRAWLLGMSRRHGLWQAIVHWHRQAQLEAAFQANLSSTLETLRESPRETYTGE